MKNLKIGVLHVNTAKAEGTSPTMRIARFTADTLGVPLIHDEKTADEYAGTKFDVLLMKFGILKFSGHRDQTMQIFGDAQRIVNLENDYTFKPDSRFRKMGKPYSVWSTVPKSVEEHGGRYVNWNVLTWLYPHCFQDVPTFHGDRHMEDFIFYHGAFKDIRLESFNRYLRDDAPYHVSVATHIPNRKKWLKAGFNPTFITLDPVFKLQDYNGTVYMEDDYSHETFCSLGNRFYECLELGVPMYIDHKALGSFVKAKMYHPLMADWVVSSATGVKRLMDKSDQVRREQQALWWADYPAQLKDQLKRAASAL